MLSPRNQIEVVTMFHSQVQVVDTLFDICDSEFNSRQEVHTSFKNASSMEAWARYYLLHEVRNVAQRESLHCSYHMSFVIAKKLSELWFEHREMS